MLTFFRESRARASQSCSQWSLSDTDQPAAGSGGSLTRSTPAVSPLPIAVLPHSRTASRKQLTRTHTHVRTHTRRSDAEE